MLSVLYLYSVFCPLLVNFFYVCSATLQDNELLLQLYPKEDDIVFLWLPQHHNYYMQDDGEMQNEAHVAHVSRTSRFSGEVKSCILNTMCKKFK